MWCVAALGGRCDEKVFARYNIIITFALNNYFGILIQQYYNKMDLSNILAVSGKPDLNELISRTKNGAIVKNLVAIERAGLFNDNEAVDSICAKLTNKKEVQKSRLLPFRFLSTPCRS